jgi:hypothetical protein
LILISFYLPNTFPIILLYSINNYKGKIKTILNISQSFEPLFKKQSSESSLTKAEQIAYDNIIRMNEKYTSFLDTFIEVINYTENAELNISRFFNNVRKISDARIRNQYYNMFLLNNIANMTVKVGKTIRPISNNIIEKRDVYKTFQEKLRGLGH